MTEEEVKDDELHLQDPWLLAELEKESDSISERWPASNGLSKTVITLRLKGEEWCRVVSKAHVTTDDISNPIDIAALAHAVANTVAKAFFESLTKKILPPAEVEMNPSFDVEKFMYGLPQFVPIRMYSNDEKLYGRENYWEWVRMITADLQDNNLYSWIESMYAESTGLPSEVRMRYDNQVQQILYASTVPKLHTFLVQFDSAFECFHRLEERFGRQKTKDFVDLFNKLETLQVRPRQEMTQFLVTFANLREEFRVRLPALDDLFFCAKLLLKLKPWYPAVVQTLSNAPKEQLTFDLIRERILVAEKAERLQLDSKLRQQQRSKTPFFHQPRFDEARQTRFGSVKRNKSNFFSAFETKKWYPRSDNRPVGNYGRRFASVPPTAHKQWKPPIAFQQRNRRGFEPWRQTPANNANYFAGRQHFPKRNKPFGCFGCGKRGHHVAICPNAGAGFCNRCSKPVYTGLRGQNMGGRKNFSMQTCNCNRF